MSETTTERQGLPRDPLAADYRFAANWCRLDASKPYRAPMAPGLRAEADEYDRIADEMDQRGAS